MFNVVRYFQIFQPKIVVFYVYLYLRELNFFPLTF